MTERLHALAAAAPPLPHELAESYLSPALVIRLDRVRANVARVLALCGGAPERWRPHVKTAKVPEVFAEIARSGVRAFKTATTRETLELLGALRREGLEGGDVLVAYPLVGPALGRVAALAAAFPETRLSVLCEEAGAVRDVPGSLGVFVDVDPGMHRTGAPPEDRARIRAVALAARERFRGVHFYDGHLHQADQSDRRARAWRAYDVALALCADLRAAGAPPGELVTSGTPTFRHALAHPGLAALEGVAHTVSPGTVVYHDLRSELENPELGLEPAALVHARVVSRPDARSVTCDAGSKSIAAEAGHPCALVLGHPELRARVPSEEHLPLDVLSGPAPERGAGLLLFPRHVCPTINLAEEAVLVDGERLVGVVPVKARAHELAP